MVQDGQNDLLIISTLSLIHGILLLHPPSRALFSREIYMNVSVAVDLCRHGTDFHLAPARPTRANQLSGHTISNFADLGDRSARSAPEHANFRVLGWPFDNHVSIQAAIDQPRG